MAVACARARPSKRRIALLELDVAGHRDQVLHAFRLQEGEQRRGGEAAVQADPEFRVWEGGPELGQEAAQDADGPQRRRGIAGAQDGGHQVLRPLGVEGERPHDGQVAPGVVVPVEEAQLLLPVRRVVRGIEVHRDLADSGVGRAGPGGGR